MPDRFKDHFLVVFESLAPGTAKSFLEAQLSDLHPTSDLFRSNAAHPEQKSAVTVFRSGIPASILILMIQLFHIREIEMKKILATLAIATIAVPAVASVPVAERTPERAFQEAVNSQICGESPDNVHKAEWTAEGRVMVWCKKKPAALFAGSAPGAGAGLAAGNFVPILGAIAGAGLLATIASGSSTSDTN